MKITAVIPVRYGATRFPGKPLAPILGKPMIQWVIDGVTQSHKITDVIIATDDSRIQSVVEELGVTCVMTGDLPTGSDRVWQAVKDTDADFVINVQGDEPLITGEVLDALVSAIEAEPSYDSYTLCKDINESDLKKSQTAKIVLNQNNEAIYFSRFPIPHSRIEGFSGAKKHIGIYAYKKAFLGEFCKQGPVELEKFEGLEQLRVLYMGRKMKVVPVNFDSWGVDLPEDIERVENELRKR